MACSTIAVGSGISASSTPIRISPPAMPNRPDRKAVATIRAPRAAIINGVILISDVMLPLRVLTGRGVGGLWPPSLLFQERRCEASAMGEGLFDEHSPRRIPLTRAFG